MPAQCTGELEDPFGNDANDLPLDHFQDCCMQLCACMWPGALQKLTFHTEGCAPEPRLLLSGLRLVDQTLGTKHARIHFALTFTFPLSLSPSFTHS